MNLSIAAGAVPSRQTEDALMAWTYSNPVRIEFGADSFDKLPELIGKRAYALVTYGEPFFAELERRLRDAAGASVLTIRDVAPNPDYPLPPEPTARVAG